jgi:hypothetical protein
MTVNIYQAYSKYDQTSETAILCTACYKRWHPAGEIKLLVADVSSPCPKCQPEDYEIHLEDMRKLNA